MSTFVKTASATLAQNLASARHQISYAFLCEAKFRDLALIDENVVIFSHQEVSSVAAPYVIDSEEFSKNQALIFLHLTSKTSNQLEDGFYTIQGNLDKKGINPDNLLLISADGKEVQSLTIDQKASDQVEKASKVEITDAHYDNVNGAKTVTVSGKVLGLKFEIKVEL
ncbi:MAG: hypothetical protein AAF206_28270 [Bacteroidota bacterium]